MSLIYCPECGHEISANAVACPNCGRPIQPVAPVPAVEKNVVVRPPRESGFPSWAFVPIGLLALLLVIVAFMAFRQSDTEANTNINVNMAGRRPGTEPTRQSQTVEIPPSSSSQPVSIPEQPPTTTTVVPGSGTAPAVAPAPTKGT